MKLTIEETGCPGEAELILRCEKMTPQLLASARQLAAAAAPARISGRSGEVTALLAPADLYYFESVDSCVFAYTKNGVFEVGLTLAALCDALHPSGVLRMGKALAVNVHHISRLQSRLDGGIDCTLDNGERVVISRRYAKTLRDYLKGDAVHDAT